MFQETKRSISVLDKEINMVLIETDEGISVVLAGGDKSHIGAVAIMDAEGQLSLTSFPGHKEAIVAKEWAAELYLRHQVPVVVSAGIHYDNLSASGIEVVLAATRELLAQL